MNSPQVKNYDSYLEYSFDYAVFGNADRIYAGSYKLADYTYNENNGKQMNQMYKQSRLATKTIRAGGLHPNVKQDMTRSISRYFNQLGRDVVSNVKDALINGLPSSTMGAIINTALF